MCARKHISQNLECMDCSSALEQDTDKFYTVLELLDIGDEYPTIKIEYVHLCNHRSQNLACTDIRVLQLHYRPIVLYIFENMTPRAIL